MDNGTEYTPQQFLTALYSGEIKDGTIYTMCVKYNDGKEWCVRKPTPELGTGKKIKGSQYEGYL